jgi:MoxR-like ATPase
LHVSEALSNYVLDLAHATREHPRVALGLSTRGVLALLRAARVHAGLRGGDFVAPDDVQAVARWVLAHRLVLKPEAALDGETDLGVVGAILEATGVPR